MAGHEALFAQRYHWRRTLGEVIQGGSMGSGPPGLAPAVAARAAFGLTSAELQGTSVTIPS